MNTSKHTPGPYIVAMPADGRAVIQSYGGVAMPATMDNARFIADALNQRAELLAALRAIAEDRAVYAPELQAIARDALAKAGAA